MSILTSRRVWGGALAILGGVTGTLTEPGETEALITLILTSIGGLLSIYSKIRPNKSEL